MVIDIDYLFSKKIGVGQFFGAEKDAACIELKETSMAVSAKIYQASGDAEKLATAFNEILPSIIVDHDLWKDEAHKYTAEEVAKMVAGRAELCAYLRGRWFKEVLFSQGKESDSK